MCTGMEILGIIGAGASVASATGLIGGKDKPPVVRESPLADQSKIEAEAAQKATSRRRRLRASSLLATGGQGDASMAATAAPAAKQTLGG